MKTKKILTKRQLEAAQAYLQTGNFTETATALGIRKQSAHELVHSAALNIDINQFQEEQSRIFTQRTWGLVHKCESLLEQKLDLLMVSNNLEKEDVSKLSRVIHDLRRSMQGAANFIQINMQRRQDAQEITTDLESEAIAFLSEKYNTPTHIILSFLQSRTSIDSVIHPDASLTYQGSTRGRGLE